MKTSIPSLLKKIIFFGLATIPLLGFGQAPNIEWQNALGGTSSDYPTGVQQTTDGGYIMGGITFSNDGDVTGSHGLFEFWIVKLHNTGILSWQKALGGTGSDLCYGIEQTADGGYIAVGWSNSNDGNVGGNHGNYDYWAVKLDDVGNIQWETNLGGSGTDQALDVSETVNGDYIIVGNSNSNDGDVGGNNGNQDFWVVKLDPSGGIVWEKNYGGSDLEVAKNIEQTADGGFIVAGYTRSNDIDVSGNHGAEDFWVIKISNTGVLQWQKTLGGSAEDQAFNVGQTSDGKYMVTGYSSSTDGDVTNNHGMKDIWIVKLDTNGAVLWQKTFGGSNDEWGYGAVHTSDGVNLIVGASNSSNGDVGGNFGESDTWIVRIDNSGTLLWEKNIGGSLSEYGNAIDKTTDGGYIIASEANSNDGDVSGNHGSSDFWAVKLQPDPLAVSNFNSPALALYPNPATDFITLQLPQDATYNIEIKNSLGQNIFQDEQNHKKITLKLPSGIKSGLYFVSITNKLTHHIETVKLLVY
ncbi:T9SS type A sorting domain-containing protein [Aequorivita sp. F47161]|uniref:T9SS type A sorting domain-containing protein n=1 Tax=Aequorivita vitellina TaxID=2874475 RepID=A0A9X1U2Z9_9FLAO|nr:T9SS type A sorting domain-containing protein [Aequorivita vitellina]MCG2420410.1 T9SS type A sorting domain-containing protein [Aequorivita vitellina]